MWYIEKTRCSGVCPAEAAGKLPLQTQDWSAHGRSQAESPEGPSERQGVGVHKCILSPEAHTC